jgi:esterase/lipase
MIFEITAVQVCFACCALAQIVNCIRFEKNDDQFSDIDRQINNIHSSQRNMRYQVDNDIDQVKRRLDKIENPKQE